VGQAIELAALLESLLDNNFEELRARAEELLGSPRAPQDALLEWLAELGGGARTYLGLPESTWPHWLTRTRNCTPRAPRCGRLRFVK
jgi:hypothetical protein